MRSLADPQGRIYVAEASGLRIDRFSPPFPTAPTAAGGCGGTDATGAPIADTVQREVVRDAVRRHAHVLRARVRAQRQHLRVECVHRPHRGVRHRREPRAADPRAAGRDAADPDRQSARHRGRCRRHALLRRPRTSSARCRTSDPVRTARCGASASTPTAIRCRRRSCEKGSRSPTPSRCSRATSSRRTRRRSSGRRSPAAPRGSSSTPTKPSSPRQPHRT